MTDKRKKVEVEYVNGAQNTIEVRIEGETHTLASVLSEHVMEDSRCIFASYKVCHPMDNHSFLRITSDGTCSPKELLKDALKILEEDTTNLSQQIYESCKVIGKI